MQLRALFSTLVAAFLALTPYTARSEDRDIADFLSYPFVDNLTASSDGTVLVWKVHLRGERNLYSNAGGQVHRVTNYTADDGQDLDDVQVVAGNDAVVYLRGGVQDNAGGENINPASLLPPPARAIYLVPLAGGTPVQLGLGNSVAVSPNGNEVAFTTEAGVINLVSLKKSDGVWIAGKAEPLAIRGEASNLAWSPDGSKLAFTDTRKDHSFIVVLTPSTHSYVYATPDFSYDDFASWSPDGTRVAFIRTPGSRENESPYLDPPRQPWDIYVANATSGDARKVWEARRGMGAQFYPSASTQQLWWMRGDRIAFPWEGDGWQHLYVVPASGGSAQQLTAGNFEVETVAPRLDRTALVYSTNEGDIDRRHIWTVGLEGKPHAITAGTKDQWSPTPLASNGLAYIEAGFSDPPAVRVNGEKEAFTGVDVPANFAASAFVQPQLVTFRSTDGLLIHAQLFVPVGSGKHPGIVFNHGGPVRQMLPGFHYMEAYTELYVMNQYLVSRGFEVLSINYRGGIMYGHDFRNPAHQGIAGRGASEYQDVLAGARWFQQRGDVEANRIGIYGLSYGGNLCAMGLAHNSDIFKAGVDIAGVHNWAQWIDAGYGRPVGTPAQRAIAEKNSPVGALSTWRSPVLVSQGDDDRNVPFSEGVDLVTRLRDRGVHVETAVYPNETHENQVWQDLVSQYRASAAFLVRELMQP
jgi:dipeptidyl aminopeptidase/acylaminoacyl peptidase